MGKIRGMVKKEGVGDDSGMSDIITQLCNKMISLEQELLKLGFNKDDMENKKLLYQERLITNEHVSHISYYLNYVAYLSNERKKYYEQ